MCCALEMKINLSFSEKSIFQWNSQVLSKKIKIESTSEKSKRTSWVQTLCETVTVEVIVLDLQTFSLRMWHKCLWQSKSVNKKLIERASERLLSVTYVSLFWRVLNTLKCQRILDIDLLWKLFECQIFLDAFEMTCKKFILNENVNKWDHMWCLKYKSEFYNTQNWLWMSKSSASY